MERRIEQFIEKEIFSHVDVYFAEHLLGSQEETPAFFLLCTLLAMARAGHLCLQLQDGQIVPPLCLLAEQENDAEFLAKQIVSSFYQISEMCSPFIVLKENRLYLQKNWELEERFCFHLERLHTGSLFFSIQTLLPSCLLNQEQNQALFCALRSPISIISGGPGTGKTFTAVEIVKSFLSSLSPEDRAIAQVKFVAPTGKAAALLEKKVRAQLGALSNVQYGTLHSFLKADSSPVFADLFLVDEASMLDAHLFVKLLSSLQTGGRLVLMGDKNQLPPVEAGSFFSDLMDFASFIPSTNLTQGLRVENDALALLAQKILQADYAEIAKHPSVQIVSSLDADLALEFIWQKSLSWLIQDALRPPEKILHSMEKFRVLSSMRKGLLGVENINRVLVERLIEGKDAKQVLAIPILIVENDKESELMNGDTGVLLASVSSIKKGIFGLEDKAYFFDKTDPAKVKEIVAPACPSFSWGYCLSIHKSQGSEYESALVLIPPGSERFGREILYTAVTRAKKELHLLAQESCFIALLQKKIQKKSGLFHLLQKTVR